MRDPKRIKEFCDTLAYLWEHNTPDWRFGQLICNIFESDPFYLEDDKALTMIKDFFGED